MLRTRLLQWGLVLSLIVMPLSALAIETDNNTTNDKVRFDFNEVNTSTLRGGTNEFISGVIFKKIADT